MRISVLGNSDTTGIRLGGPERTWPTLLQERLDGTSRGIAVDNWRWAAYRPGAVDYALALVEEAKPDMVIITLASFWCAFGTVQIRVRERFGRRVADVYRRLERAANRSQADGDGAGKPTNTLSRRLARRLLGTGTLMSVDGFIETYAAVIRQLSRDENLQILILGDHHFTADVRRAMPQIEPAIQRIEAAIRPLVVERHLEWGDLEEAISAGGGRERMILGDGIHMTEEAHRRVADALEPALREMLERVAPPV